MKFITIPDTDGRPVLVNVEHIETVKMIDEKESLVTSVSGDTFSTTLQRDIIVGMLMKKSEDEIIEKKEPIPVNTGEKWIG